MRESFLELFPFKVNVFLTEVMSVMLTPIILCFSLPNCAASIIEFVRLVWFSYCIHIYSFIVTVVDAEITADLSMELALFVITGSHE